MRRKSILTVTLDVYNTFEKLTSIDKVLIEKGVYIYWKGIVYTLLIHIVFSGLKHLGVPLHRKYTCFPDIIIAIQVYCHEDISPLVL